MNKPQLQKNNYDLNTALDVIQGLPMADDVRHGRHMWRKYSATMLEDPTFQCAPGGTNQYEHVITFTDGMNLESLGLSFLDGFHVGMSLYYTYDPDAQKLYFGSARGSRAYYISSHSFEGNKLVMQPNANYMTLAEGTIQYDGLKLFNKTFAGFAVSDHSERYPEKGRQGNHYYEKINFPTAKFDMGTFTTTEPMSNSTYIEHNLGVTPKIVFVIKTSYGTGRLAYAISGVNFRTSNENKSLIAGPSNTAQIVVSLNNAEHFAFGTYNSDYYYDGTYMWIAVA